MPPAAEALHAVGIRNVVMWESGRSVPMLPALHFSHAFLSTLAFPHAGYNEVSIADALQMPLMGRLNLGGRCLRSAVLELLTLQLHH